MLSLSILKYLEDNGFGVIDKDLFWEKMGLDEIGLYITDIGTSRSRDSRKATIYEIFSRGFSDVDGYQRLERVADFLNNSFGVCKLPPVPPISYYGYGRVTFLPVSAISSEGVDENGRTIFSITGQVYHDERTYYPPPMAGKYLITESKIALLSEGNRKLIIEESIHD